MNKRLIPLILLITLVGCRSDTTSHSIVSMQVVDRNGFSETISNQDRLKVYEGVDFLAAQPYEKVLRVYKKDQEGKSHSKLTSYHTNGGVWQFLEATDGRAHGKYLEWYENGKVKIEAKVIEGLADLSAMAQNSWIFDGACTVWDEQGNKQASFSYDKGYLVEEAKYYFPNGKIEKILPYKMGKLDGLFLVYNDEGDVIEKVQYKNGVKEGSATAFWDQGVSKYQEQYRDGLLVNAIYFDKQGHVISEVENGQGTRAEFSSGALHRLVEIQNGKPEGEVKIFTPTGTLLGTLQIHEGKKTGPEWEYYPSHNDDLKPKLMVHWVEDQIQGMVKTWYSNGVLESQREMVANKKHGLSLAYYQSGDLMLMEEYEEDKLVKGSYYKKGENSPISTIEKGEGTATLFNAQGVFLKKVTYERGRPSPT